MSGSVGRRLNSHLGPRTQLGSEESMHMLEDCERPPLIMDGNISDGNVSPWSCENFPFGQVSSSNSSIDLNTAFNDEDENDDVSIGDIIDALYPFQRPKRIRLPRRPVPRLLQSDPRRFYTSMLLNALNSNDAPYLRSFVERYMIPHATLRRPVAKMGVVTKPSLLLVGSESMLRFWNFQSAFIPDRVAQAENIRVVRYSNSEACKVVCDLILTSTQIYEDRSVKSLVTSAMLSTPGMEMKVVSDGYEYHSTKLTHSTHLMERKRPAYVLNETTPSDSRVTYGPVDLVLMEKPRLVQMAMTLTLHINELRQITSVEYGTASFAF